MNSDINYLNEIMSISQFGKLVSNYFCWLYLFTNENISGFYKKLDFNNKSVLTVTSSGDHALNAYLHGAKTVSSFDINPLAKYLSELKISAIKSLTREEFILFFNKKLNSLKPSKYFFSKDIYFDKLRNNLSGDCVEFWDYLFENYSNVKIKNSYLFTEDKLPLECILKVNDYLSDDKNYYKLRYILKNKDITYYDIDIKELSKISNNFDLIILSNIANYLDLIYKKEHLKNFKELITNLKTNNNQIVINYFYDYSLLMFNDDFTEYNKYFDIDNYDYIVFDSASNNKKLIFKKYDNDVILVSKNKKEEI